MTSIRLNVYTASWKAVFQDDQGVGFAFFPYLIEFDTGVVIARDDALIFREDNGRTFEDNTDESFAFLRTWAKDRGFRDCARCQ
ncbi:hypothetical protein BH24ACT15_BH24ACT15_12970 [soil metagenome]